jgi:hypothetical protein
MTTIYLRATDQVLAVSQRPKIAAGDVESVKIHVEFDSMWDRYAGKTAVFYTSHDATRYEVMLKLDECIVPHEVLCKEGTLFIGVYALSIDGTSTKTSTIVKQKLVKGADSGARTLFPSPNIYTQFVSDANEKVNELVNAQISAWDKEVQQRKNQLNAYLTEAKEFMEGTVVWTNSDETASMPNQTITKDLSKYIRFKVLYKFETTSTDYQIAEVTEKEKTFLLSANALKSSTSFTENYANRRITVTDSTIKFSEGFKINQGSIDNTRCVPCKIIAYEY